jgi:hypothetical protein
MLCTSVVLVVLHTRGNTSGKAGLDNFSTIVALTTDMVTASAIVIGGIWAYYKYSKDRGFHSKLSINLQGRWHDVDGKNLLQVWITVKNVGAPKVTLLQEGTWLGASLLAEKQPEPPGSVKWDSAKLFEVLTEHSWIEPGETISDDLILDLAVSRPLLTLLEARLVCYRRRGNIEIVAHRVIPADSKITDVNET